MFREKWAAAKVACGMIVREIYLFRGAQGRYDTSTGDEDEGLSKAAKSKRARMRFVSTVHGIFNNIMVTELKSSFVNISSSDNMLTAELLPAYVACTLYNLKVSQGTLAKLSAFCACCRCFRRKMGRTNSRTMVHEYAPMPGTVTIEGDSDYENDAPLMTDALSIATTAEEGQNGFQSFEDPLRGVDDFLSAVTAEAYFTSRTQNIKDMAQRASPSLARQQDFGDVLIFLCSFAASLLGALNHSSWIPIVVGFSAQLTAVLSFKGLRPLLETTNQAIAGLKNIEMEWSALSTMDRRTPMLKRKLITMTEQYAFSIVQASVGSSSSTDAKMVEEDNEKGGEKDQGGDKDKKNKDNKKD